MITCKFEITGKNKYVTPTGTNTSITLTACAADTAATVSSTGQLQLMIKDTAIADTLGFGDVIDIQIVPKEAE